RAPADDRRQHQEPGARRLRHDAIDHLLHRLGGDRPTAARAVRDAHAREEHAQIVVDLGDGPDGRARVLRSRLLLDRDRGRQPLDRVHLGLLHLLEELARIGRERLDVAALALGIDRVEGQRRFSGPREPRDDDELVARDLEIDVLEVVLAGAPDDDPVAGHVASLLCQSRAVRARSLAAASPAPGPASRGMATAAAASPQPASQARHGSAGQSPATAASIRRPAHATSAFAGLACIAMTSRSASAVATKRRSMARTLIATSARPPGAERANAGSSTTPAAAGAASASSGATYTA